MQAIERLYEGKVERFNFIQSFVEYISNEIEELNKK